MSDFESDHLANAVLAQESSSYQSLMHNARKLAASTLAGVVSLIGAGSAMASSLPENQNAILPESVENILNKDTVYLANPSGCTGTLIRNEKGKILGAVSANHCDLMQYEDSRYKVNDKTYIVIPGLVHAYQGPNLDHEKSVAVFDKVITPDEKNGYERDVALYVSRGKNITPEEVYKAYEKSALTQKELLSLKFNQTVYFAGYPVYQPGNHGSTRVEKYAAHFLGVGTAANTSESQTLRVDWLAVEPTKDKSSASYGDSGAAAFVMVNNEPKFIGDESAFYDLTGKVPSYSGEPTVPNMGPSTGTASVAGFSYQASGPKAGGEVLQIVNDEGDIPGMESPTKAFMAAEKAFTNPNIPKTYIDGDVAIDSPTYHGSVFDGETGTFGPNSYDVLEKPMIAEEGSDTILGWANPASSDDLAMIEIDNADLMQDAQVFADPNEAMSGTTVPTLGETQGAIQYNTDPANLTWGNFTDAADVTFGDNLMSPYSTTLSGPAYYLSSNNGTITLNEELKGGGGK